VNANTVTLGYNEHSVITNEYFGPKSQFSTKIEPVITNEFGWSQALHYNRRDFDCILDQL